MMNISLKKNLFLEYGRINYGVDFILYYYLTKQKKWWTFRWDCLFCFCRNGFCNRRKLHLCNAGVFFSCSFKNGFCNTRSICFFVIMGYYLGKAKSSDKSKVLYIFLSLLIPVIFQALYNYFLFLDFIPGIWLGGIGKLLLALYISKNSIVSHLKASPFNKNKS